MSTLVIQGYEKIERAIISKISAVNVLPDKENLLDFDFGESIFQSVCNMFRKYFVNLYIHENSNPTS